MSEFFIIDLYPEDKAKIEKGFSCLVEKESLDDPDCKTKYIFVVQAIFNGGKIEKIGGRFILGDTARKIADLSYNYCLNEEDS